MEEVFGRTRFPGVKSENLRAFGHKKDFVEAFIGELEIYRFGGVFETSSRLASANFPLFGPTYLRAFKLASHLSTSSSLV